MEGLVQDKYLGQVENKADEDAEEDLLGYFEYLNHGLDPEIGWRTCCKKIVPGHFGMENGVKTQ